MDQVPVTRTQILQQKSRDSQEKWRMCIPFPAEYDMSGMMFSALLWREEQAILWNKAVYDREFSTTKKARETAHFDYGATSEGVHNMLIRPIPQEDIDAMRQYGHRMIEFGAFTWDDVIHALKLFKQMNGHVDVPLNYTIDLGFYEKTYCQVYPSPPAIYKPLVPIDQEYNDREVDDMNEINVNISEYQFYRSKMEEYADQSNENKIIKDLREAIAYSITFKYIKWREAQSAKKWWEGTDRASLNVAPPGGLSRCDSWRCPQNASLYIQNLTLSPSLSAETAAILKTFIEQNTYVNISDTKKLQSMTINITGLPVYPERLHGLRLGHAIASIRIGDVEAIEDPQRRMQLDSIGFNWGDTSQYFRFPFVPFIMALRIFKHLNFHTVMPYEYVVPSSPQWPYWMEGIPLGLWSCIARIQQQMIATRYPTRKQMLDDLGFLWWIPPDPDVPRKYYLPIE